MYTLGTKSYVRLIDEKLNHLFITMCFKDFTNFIIKDFAFNFANIIYVNKLRVVKSWPEMIFLSLAVKKRKKYKMPIDEVAAKIIICII